MKPIPHPSILDELEPLGFVHGERRWRDEDGRLYTWDGLHCEVEVYTARGRHLAAVDPVTRSVLKQAVKGRRIKV